MLWDDIDFYKVKRILASIVIALFASTSLGCSFANIKYGINNDSNISKGFSYYGQYGNLELIEEITDTYDIPQSELDSALYVASRCMGDSYKTMTLLIDKGANANTNDMVWEFSYNANPNQLNAIMKDEDLDIDRKDELGFSALAMALTNTLGSDFLAYELCDILLENGAKITEDIFINDDIDLYHAPMSTKMLINKYLDNGGKLDVPESYKYALCGDIEKAVKYAPEDNKNGLLSEHQQETILNFSQCFGTPKQYETLFDLFDLYHGKAAEYIPRMDYDKIAGCGNIEMFEYMLKVKGDHIRFDPENDLTDQKSLLSFTFDYKFVAEAFDSAAKFHDREMCEYLMDNGIKPSHGLTSYPLLSCASDDYELFAEIYHYVKENFDDITEDNVIFSIVGYHGEITEDDKKIADLLLSDGYTFEQLYQTFFTDTQGEYLISHGADINDELVKKITERNYPKSLKAIIERGYEIKPEILTFAIEFASSDMIKMILDSGTKMEDNILEDSYLASKSTVKLLIERGARTDIAIKEISGWGSDPVRNGQFRLKDVYKHRGRADLIELVE